MRKTHLQTADSCSSSLSLTHYWYVINAIQCVTVFSPLLHLWVLCYPSHCCIHFWILKSRSQYTPKADPLRLTRLSLFLLSYIYFLFCFEVCFFSSSVHQPCLLTFGRNVNTEVFLHHSHEWMEPGQQYLPLVWHFGLGLNVSAQTAYLCSWIALYTTLIQKTYNTVKLKKERNHHIVNPYFIHNWT